SEVRTWSCRRRGWPRPGNPWGHGRGTARVLRPARRGAWRRCPRRRAPGTRRAAIARRPRRAAGDRSRRRGRGSCSQRDPPYRRRVTTRRWARCEEVAARRRARARGAGSAAPAEEAAEAASARSALAGSAGAVPAVVRLAEALVDLLALRAHRVLLGITPGHPHLAAQGDHGRAAERGLGDLVLAHVMGEPVVVAVVGRLLLLLQLPVQHRGAARGGTGIVAVGVHPGRVGGGGHDFSLDRWRDTASLPALSGSVSALPPRPCGPRLGQSSPWTLSSTSFAAYRTRSAERAVPSPGGQACSPSHCCSTSASTCPRCRRAPRAPVCPAWTRACTWWCSL